MRCIVIFHFINMRCVFCFRYVNTPSGNIGVYDPAEIHNRHTLKGHMNVAMIKLGYHLIFFFIYLYK